MSDERKWEPDNRQAEGSPGANENRENIQNEQDTRNAQNTTNGKNTQSGESREEKRPMTHPYSRYNPESQNASGIDRYGNPEPQRRRESAQNGSVPPRYGYYQVHENQGSAGGNGNPPRPPKNRKSGGGFWKKAGCAALLAVIFGVVAGGIFFGMGTLVKEEQEPIASTEILQEENGASEGNQVSGNAYSVADVAQASMPSVVAITSVSVQEIPDYFGIFGYGAQQYQSAGSGSGIIVGENDDELLIATNNHVVAGATTLSVCFIGKDVVNAEEETQNLASGDGDINVEDAVNAKIKGTDEENDLAVVSVKKSDIPEDTMSEIKIAQLGNSDGLIVGEQVVAIGNALGYGQSVTSGWVSALNRSIATDEGTNTELIQTDAAINPGNSGGALVNANGEVIGINSAKLIGEDVEGIGYAIPISDVTDIITNLMNQETKTKVSEAERGYLGITGLDVEDSDSQRYGMPTGVYISEVSRGGGAADAGITKGSIIVGFNGITIDSMESLQEQLQYYKKGEKVTLTLQVPGEGGEYQEQTVDVTLGRKAQ